MFLFISPQIPSQAHFEAFMHSMYLWGFELTHDPFKMLDADVLLIIFQHSIRCNALYALLLQLKTANLIDEVNVDFLLVSQIVFIVIL